MSEEVTSIAPELPADLKAYVETAKAFAQTHNLLAQGLFPHKAFNQVDQCLKFIKTLHAEAMRVASEHPESDIFPELKAFKEQVKATEIKEESPVRLEDLPQMTEEQMAATAEPVSNEATDGQT